MAFKKGDVVEVIPEKAGAVSKQYIGQKLVVTHVTDFGSIQIAGVDGYFRENKFRLVKEELVFAVGAQVERIGADLIAVRIGQKYIIETVYRDAMGGVECIKLQGINARYHVRGFKVVANAPKNAFDPQQWIPQDGEKVFIIAKDKWHAHRTMCGFVDDGKEYTISQSYNHPFTYQVKLNNGYVYDPRVSLRPVWAGKVDQKSIPKPEKPKEPEHLHEHLFQKQKAVGLGAGLCSYAVEYACGTCGFHVGDVCHARLNRNYAYDRPPKGEVVKLVYGLRHDFHRAKGQEQDMEAYKEYVDYIVNRSPWAVAFLTKDITDDLYMNVECNRHIIAGACVALRTGQEYPDRPVMFKMIKDMGHSEHTAWVFSCAFDKQVGDKFSFRGWNGGHDVISSGANHQELIKFFIKGYHNAWGGEKEPYRIEHGNYSIAYAVSEHNGPNVGDWLKKNTEVEITGEGWDKTTLIRAKALHDVATKYDNLIKGQA